LIIPIRCFSCGKPVAHLREKYEELIKKESPKEALDKLGLNRQCCRALFLTHVDMMDTIARYRK